MLKRFNVRYAHYCFCLVFALWCMGCAARYSTENLRRLAPAAEIVDVCVRIPTFESGMVVVAHNSQTRTSVSDRDWDEFERAAEIADVIYRYDPNAPKESPSRLPWPYHRMSCQTVSSSEKVSLPKGMAEISISGGMREALVAALMVDEPMRASRTAMVPAPDKRFVAQLSPMGFGPRATYSSEAVDEVGHMLRDALRKGAPTVSNGAGGQISILDTTAGQVVGGLGAGALIGTTPGGALVAAKLQANPNLRQPTREFLFGQSVGEMGSGVLQLFIGTGGTVGGVGLSMSGGGSVVGVPTCIAGAALAANGTITFIHGAHTLIVTLCHWDDLPSANAAQALDAPGPAPAPAGPPAPAPAAAAPPPAPMAAKPAAQAPAPSTAVAPPPGTRLVHTTKSGSTTKTVRKAPPGQKAPEITTEIHTSEGSATATTTVKGKPSSPKRPGNRGHDDHQADVNGGGQREATDLARPGEKVETEKPVQGHPGVTRRPDNQIIGTDGKTRVVVESERRPDGPYHKKRVKELEGAGIEVHTRPPSEWKK